MSKLRHENVLPLLGITTGPDGTVSIVTEWMTRGNAHNYVQDTNVDPRPLVSKCPTNGLCGLTHLQIFDIAHGLFYLHSHASGPIIHGDLKGVGLLDF